MCEEEKVGIVHVPHIAFFSTLCNGRYKTVRRHCVAHIQSHSVKGDQSSECKFAVRFFGVEYNFRHLQGLEKDTLVYLYDCFRYSNSYLEFIDCVGQLIDLFVFLGELSFKMVPHLSIGSLGEDKLVYFLHN